MLAEPHGKTARAKGDVQTDTHTKLEKVQKQLTAGIRGAKFPNPY